MTAFDEELERRLAGLQQANLYRQLRRINSAQGPRIQIDGRNLRNFSSNDYLGLATHPAVQAAATEAVARFGAGAGASRLISGSLAPHHELENALATFKGTEQALSFSTGYAAALGTVGALLGRSDVIVLDRLVHACLVDAARLSGAKLRVFAHNDSADLERILHWARSKTGAPRPPGHILIVTESVFSMDGDRAPLQEIVRLKEQYGAWLMVDEAHATGLYGEHGRGLAEELRVSDQIEIQMGTLGKALGASGGYICGSRFLIDYLINRARSFVFSTAPVPAAAAAAAAAIRLVQSAAGQRLRNLLWERIGEFRSQTPAHLPADAGAIVPILLGEEAEAVRASMSLRERGFFVPAIRFPTVARGRARLRATLTAAHSAEDISALVAALNEAVPREDSRPA